MPMTKNTFYTIAQLKFDIKLCMVYEFKIIFCI